MNIMEMTIHDYPEVKALWEKCEGVRLRDEDDSKDGVEKYLNRNPGLSCVARENAKIVGAVLAGHDGRRGYLHHLAVDADFRRQGIGRALVKQSLSKLWVQGIRKCHIFIMSSNADGETFWRSLGWVNRHDLIVASKIFNAESFCNYTRSTK